MADTNELNPCPCGKTPDRLGISDGGQGGKYHFVAGDCCSEWMIEFRANYKPIESDECMALAVAAWNDSPRALVCIKDAPQPADAALVYAELKAAEEDIARHMRTLAKRDHEIARLELLLGKSERKYGEVCDELESLRALSQPAAPVAQVPEGFVLCEIGVLSESFLDAAIRDADHVRNICEDLDVVLSAGIHAYLLAASKAAAPSAKGGE